MNFARLAAKHKDLLIVIVDENSPMDLVRLKQTDCLMICKISSQRVVTLNYKELSDYEKRLINNIVPSFICVKKRKIESIFYGIDEYF